MGGCCLRSWDSCSAFFAFVALLPAKYIVEGWTTLVVINLFIGGMILFALGLIGEYVGRSSLLLNSRAQYTNKEIGGRK